MRVHNIVNTVPAMAACRLGMVLAAHGNRAFCRAHAQAASNAKDTAQHDLEHDGLDARWFTEKALENATGAFTEAVRAKIAAEKFYRKQRLDFLNEFPELAPILETMIPGSTQDFVAK